MQQYDVVVVGGGLVGATLAQMLPNLRVAIVEAYAPPAALEQPGFDVRTTVVSARTQELFNKLGLWSAMQPYAGTIKSIEVSDRGHFAGTELHAQDAKVDGLGYVVPNSVMGYALYQGLEHVDLYAPDRVTEVAPNNGGALITLQSGQVLSTQLAVIADGAHSPTATALGIGYDEHPYQHQVLVGTVTAAHADKAGWAYERFTDEGAVALLPLPAHDDHPDVARYSFVWAMPPQAAACRQAMPLEQLGKEMTARFGTRLGELSLHTQPVLVPLKRVLAHEQVRQGIVLMGNAAHTLHPVAGQGFNLSARDCDVLAKLLNRAHRQNKALGSLALLDQYLAARKTDQWQVTQLSHHLSDVFSQQSVLVAAGRGIATLALTLSPALKQGFTRSAMGYNYV